MANACTSTREINNRISDQKPIDPCKLIFSSLLKKTSFWNSYYLTERIEQYLSFSIHLSKLTSS